MSMKNQVVGLLNPHCSCQQTGSTDRINKLNEIIFIPDGPMACDWRSLKSRCYKLPRLYQLCDLNQLPWEPYMVRKLLVTGTGPTFYILYHRSSHTGSKTAIIHSSSRLGDQLGPGVILTPNSGSLSLASSAMACHLAQPGLIQAPGLLSLSES